MAAKRQNTAARREQIIDAARKLIIRHGSEHVTVNRIAKEVGFSEAAIYRHFKSKKDILSLLVEHIQKELMGEITQAKSQGQTSLQLIDQVLRSQISAPEQRRGVSFQIIAEIVSFGDKKLNRQVSDAINKYIAELKNLMAEGVKDGEVREDADLESASTMLFGMVQVLVNTWTLSNYQFDPLEKYKPLWNTFKQTIIKHER